MEDILLLKRFFPIVDKCHSCEDIARQSCAMVPRSQFFASFLRPVFPASHVQHVLDLHSKIDGRKIEVSSLPLSLEGYAGDCNNWMT